VVAPGTINRGDPIVVISQPEGGIDIRTLFRGLTGEPDAMAPNPRAVNASPRDRGEIAHG